MHGDHVGIDDTGVGRIYRYSFISNFRGQMCCVHGKGELRFSVCLESFVGSG